MLSTVVGGDTGNRREIPVAILDQFRGIFRVLELEELSNSLQSQLESEISQGMKDRVAMVFPLIQ